MRIGHDGSTGVTTSRGQSCWGPCPGRVGREIAQQLVKKTESKVIV